MINTVKANIALKARELGFRFDESELIDVVDNGQVFVFLRSVKAMKLVEQPDGTLIETEVNDPIIWLDVPSPLLARSEIDQERQVLRHVFYRPQLRILYPDLCQVLPRLMRE